MTKDLQADKMGKKTRNKMEQVGISGLKGESMSNKYLKLIAGIGTTRVYQPSQMVLCRWFFLCYGVFRDNMSCSRPGRAQNHGSFKVTKRGKETCFFCAC